MSRIYVELLPGHNGMALTATERVEWEAGIAKWREAELAGAPLGRCLNANIYAENPQPCDAALIPAEIEGAYCIACLWRDVCEYGSEG